jgi:transposase
MTIPGVDMVVALALIAAIGDIARFAKPEQLVGYLGLNPSVRQSGPGPAYHGRITSRGAVMPAACWSRQRGRRHGCRVRCAAFFCACRLSADSTLRPSQRGASSPS